MAIEWGGCPVGKGRDEWDEVLYVLQPVRLCSVKGLIVTGGILDRLSGVNSGEAGYAMSGSGWRGGTGYKGGVYMVGGFPLLGVLLLIFSLGEKIWYLVF
jgi:hypothetical protein